jgi:hypothetical protein
MVERKDYRKQEIDRNSEDGYIPVHPRAGSRGKEKEENAC